MLARTRQILSPPEDFDLAFGPDQLPVLASIDALNSVLRLRKWSGQAWTSLADLPVAEYPQAVKMASNWDGDVIVGVSSTYSDTSSFIHVYRLDGSRLKNLGPAIQIRSGVNGHAIPFDARGPVVAWLAGGFVQVRRWNGSSWLQLGSKVNESAITHQDPQSPALAVTGDGKLVVAYATLMSDGLGVEAKVWTGTGWTALGKESRGRRGAPAWPGRMPACRSRPS